MPFKMIGNLSLVSSQKDNIFSHWIKTIWTFFLSITKTQFSEIWHSLSWPGLDPRARFLIHAITGRYFVFWGFLIRVNPKLRDILDQASWLVNFLGCIAVIFISVFYFTFQWIVFGTHCPRSWGLKFRRDFRKSLDN